MNESTAEALSCQELVELVTAYLEGDLSAAEHARFEEHLSGCGPCQVYLEQMQTTIRLAGRLTVDAIPPEAEQELLETFRSWKRR
jgi:anti-sigma factor RsiW